MEEEIAKLKEELRYINSIKENSLVWENRRLKSDLEKAEQAMSCNNE